jgi:hypothetical protein
MDLLEELSDTRVVFGTQDDDTLTGHPGDVVFGRHGNDAIDISPVIGTGDVTGEERAFVFGGVGNDTVTDGSVKESVFPVTAFGGAGDDTFLIPSVDDPDETSFLTGGPGHDLFAFSVQPFHAVDNTTITDFGRHDAIRLDLDLNNPETVTFTDQGDFTEVKAATATGATVDLHLAGDFDESRFEVAHDGEGHAFITYGHGAGDWFMS